MAEAPILYRIPDACAVVGIGRSQLYELMRSGAIKSVNVGRSRLIPRQSLEDFAARLMAGDDIASTPGGEDHAGDAA